MLLEKAIRKDTLVSSVKRFFLTPANFRLLFFVVLYCDIRYLSPVVYQTVILVMTLWSAVLMADQYIVKKRIMRVKFRRIIFVFLFFALVTVMLHGEINLWKNLMTLWWIVVCLFLFYGVHAEKSNLRVRREAMRVFDLLNFMTVVVMAAGFILFIIFPKGVSLMGYQFCIVEGRFVGIIPNANVTGFYAAMAIVFSAMLLRMRRADGTSTRRLRIWYISGIVLNSFVLILTDSNAAMVFIMVFISFLFFYEMFKEFSLKKLHTIVFRLAATVLACVVVVSSIMFLRVNVQNGVAGMLSWRDTGIVISTTLDANNDNIKLDKAAISPKPSNTKKVIGHQNTNIDSGRFVLWRQALGLIEIYPLFGIGKENIPDYGVDYLGGIRYTDLGGYKYVDFHNGLLTITVSFGIVGLSLFLVFALTIAKAILKSMFKHKQRSRRDGNMLVLIAAFSAAYCVYSMFEAALFIDYTYRVFIFWFILGLGLSYVMKYHQQGLNSRIDPAPINDDTSELQYIRMKWPFFRKKAASPEEKPEPEKAEDPSSEAKPEPETAEEPSSEEKPEPEKAEEPSSEEKPEPEKAEDPSSEEKPEPEKAEEPSSEEKPEPETAEEPSSEEKPEPEKAEEPSSEAKPEPEKAEEPSSEEKPEPEKAEEPSSEEKPEPEKKDSDLPKKNDSRKQRKKPSKNRSLPDK